jgi:hypothetical protein
MIVMMKIKPCIRINIYLTYLKILSKNTSRLGGVCDRVTTELVCKHSNRVWLLAQDEGQKQTNNQQVHN